MKKGLANFIGRISSRKFLLTVAAGLTFYANGQYAELAATIITYITLEGGADVMGSYARNKYAVPAQIEQTTQLKIAGEFDDEPTSKNIVPGFVTP